MPCFDSLGSNGRDGSDCGCKDGFNGSVIEKKVTDDSLMVLHPNCEPAVCDIENSNKEPGPNCRCSDSYWAIFRKVVSFSLLKQKLLMFV